jgi:hypothetical protein
MTFGRYRATLLSEIKFNVLTGVIYLFSACIWVCNSHTLFVAGKLLLMGLSVCVYQLLA